MELEKVVFIIRGQKVMLSTDLARLYGVEPRVLMQSVRRNIERFPADFMFPLTLAEARDLLKSQFVTLNRGQHIKKVPYAFTEQGVAMLSSVLSSPKAIQVNIAVMRAFVRLRETLSLHKDLAAKLDALDKRVGGHDAEIRSIFQALRELMAPPKKPAPRIGFQR